MNIRTFAVSAVCAAVLLAVYLPPALACYGVSDDYLFLLYQIVPDVRGYGTDVHLATGRPALAVIHDLTFGLARGVDDLRWIRLAAVGGLLVLGLVLGRTLTAAGWTALEAGAIVVAVASTPPFQVMLTWAMLGPGLIVAALLSAAAVALSARTGRWAALASMACMAIAFTIHQGLGTFAGLFLAARMLAPDDPPPWTVVRDASLRLGVRMLAAMGVAFVIWQLGMALRPGVIGGERNTLGAALPVKIGYVGVTLEAALSVSRVPPSRVVAEAVGAFIVVGLAWFARPQRGKRFAWCVLLLVLAWLPYLLSRECNPTYRSQAVLTSLLILYAACAVRGLVRRPAVSGVLLAACALFAAREARDQVWQHVVRPQVAESCYLRDQLMGCDLSRPVRIIRAHWSDTPGPASLIDASEPYTLMDDYGAPSCAQAWCIKPMAEMLMMRPLRVLVVDADTDPRVGAGFQTIDMRRLRDLRGAPLPDAPVGWPPTSWTPDRRLR